MAKPGLETRLSVNYIYVYVKYIYISLCVCVFLSFFRAIPTACGGSQARDLIGAVAASLYTTATVTPDLSCVCGLNHSLRQYQIPNPLSEARD